MTQVAIKEFLAKEGVLGAVVLRSGVLAFEMDAHTPREIFSCTKSVVSALVGIADGMGLFGPCGVDSPVGEILCTGSGGRILLRHLLAMNSGIDWPEWREWNYSIESLVKSPNWVRYVLERPRPHEPGKIFNYNTGGSHLLAAAVTKVSGQDLLEFARKNLFDPAGIGHVEWSKDPQGIRFGGSGMKMSAKDMAKFGQVYLRLGRVEASGGPSGQSHVQVIPEDWVLASTERHSAGVTFMGTGYGYSWWLSQTCRLLGDDRKDFERLTVRCGFPDDRGFYALGVRGQAIFVLPSIDVVAAFQSNVRRRAAFRPGLLRYVLRQVFL